jgi:PIN domain nuclease of toxin-antitoxin system
VNLLLDTHVLIWWLEKSSRLGAGAKKILLSPSTRPVVSAVSIWEISIKSAIDRLEMTDPPEIWAPRLENEWGVRSLPITFEHAAAVRGLPRRHNDPFDRMLVAQAQCESLAIITADPALSAYDVRTIDARL